LLASPYRLEHLKESRYRKFCGDALGGNEVGIHIN